MSPGAVGLLTVAPSRGLVPFRLGGRHRYRCAPDGTSPTQPSRLGACLKRPSFRTAPESSNDGSVYLETRSVSDTADVPTADAIPAGLLDTGFQLVTVADFNALGPAESVQLPSMPTWKIMPGISLNSGRDSSTSTSVIVRIGIELSHSPQMGMPAGVDFYGTSSDVCVFLASYRLRGRSSWFWFRRGDVASHHAATSLGSHGFPA